jgi:hypothetical protein
MAGKHCRTPKRMTPAEARQIQTFLLATVRRNQQLCMENRELCTENHELAEANTRLCECNQRQKDVISNLMDQLAWRQKIAGEIVTIGELADARYDDSEQSGPEWGAV